MSRPTAEVKWCFNGKEVKQSTNITIAEDEFIRRLTVHSPTPEDSGKYTCYATDDKIDFQVKVLGMNVLPKIVLVLEQFFKILM